MSELLPYRLLPELDLVYVRGRGHVSLAPVLATIGAISQDVREQPCRLEVIDLRDVDHLDMMSADMQKVVELDQGRREDLGIDRLALIGANDQVFGSLRMYELLFQDRETEIMVCRDLAAAAEFVGIPIERLEEASALFD